MGGGPDKEQLLIALWDPEPVHFTSEVKRRFPNVEINYVQIPSPAASSWKDALRESANAVPAGELLLFVLDEGGEAGERERYYISHYSVLNLLQP